MVFFFFGFFFLSLCGGLLDFLPSWLRTDWSTAGVSTAGLAGIGGICGFFWFPYYWGWVCGVWSVECGVGVGVRVRVRVRVGRGRGSGKRTCYIVYVGSSRIDIQSYNSVRALIHHLLNFWFFALLGLARWLVGIRSVRRGDLHYGIYC